MAGEGAVSVASALRERPLIRRRCRVTDGARLMTGVPAAGYFQRTHSLTSTGSLPAWFAGRSWGPDRLRTDR
jgi:hypothetical protein